MADDEYRPPPHHHLHVIRNRNRYRYCPFCRRNRCYAAIFRHYLYSDEWINRLEFMFEDEGRPVVGLPICNIQRHLYRIFLFENNYVRPIRGQRLARIPVCVSRLVNDIYPIDDGLYIGFRTHISNRVRAVNVDGEAIDNMI